MGIFHFLNVKQGDCSIILHGSGRVSVIDVNNASRDVSKHDALAKLQKMSEGVSGNFGQKDYPVNPIAYMREHGFKNVWRFILTHPDMDHMDGIKDFFAEFSPDNFWDTDNTAEKDDFGDNCPFDEADWLFYKSIRAGKPEFNPKRLALYSGNVGQYWNQGDSMTNGDGLHILAPTPELVALANETDDPNDGGYVLLYRSNAGRILIAGDSHDNTWEYILKTHADAVADVELLIAPHHGRDSGRSYKFLDVVRPKLTLFGNASSEHLAYDKWNSRKLPIITNNQANCVVVDTDGEEMQVYVTNKAFAMARNPLTTYSATHRAWYLGAIVAKKRAA